MAKILVAVAVLVAGCQSGTEAPKEADARVNVTTTIGMIADAAKEVGGEAFEVTSLMGPGIDPHLYRPTAGDLARLEKADVVLHLGLELEGRMGSVLESLKSGRRVVSAVGEAVPKERLIGVEGVPGKNDPHIWFDPNLWSLVVEEVGRALAEAAPEQKATIEARVKAYRIQLQDLDRETKQAVATVPAQDRVLVTAHDAFHYFGRAYGFQVLGIQGVSTATEASPADVRRLARLLANRKIKAVFVETSLPPATVKALQEGTASLGWKVELGGSLFSDAMGDAGTPEGTYLGMVRHNVKTIVEALK